MKKMDKTIDLLSEDGSAPFQLNKFRPLVLSKDFFVSTQDDLKFVKVEMI